jgi:hypothetical protein
VSKPCPSALRHPLDVPQGLCEPQGQIAQLLAGHAVFHEECGGVAEEIVRQIKA